ncbi:BACON domain-containing protein [Ktedonospora formicarum]|uniref:BACON domain-containing protein n=1 Tax=Ktedonospora formicarum TaxID=2778364 RepID=A0A8J3I139_9CHLR|nr:hypothetical protein [Ktedonospora formicarum]GHO45661.1 hypothetical protein KSX_38240 [Ktedonospora formicarum]
MPATPGSREEEEERRRRAALLGIPLAGLGALDNQTQNAPTVQGTPSQPRIPNAPGTPGIQQAMGNLAPNISGAGAGLASTSGIMQQPPVYTPPSGTPSMPSGGSPSGSPGTSSPPTPPTSSGCLPWILTVLTVLVILATIGTLGFVLFTPAISLNGASEVQVGNTYQLHGQGFLPSSSVTLTLDGTRPLLVETPSEQSSLSANRLGANLALARQQSVTGKTLTVSTLGAFDVQLHIDASWSPGKHTIRATGSSWQREASIPVTVQQTGQTSTKAAPTATQTPTPSPTTTETPSPTPTPTETSTTTQPPALAGVTPQHVSLSATAGNSSNTVIVTLTTSGSGALDWQANVKDSWLKVYPPQGQIQAPGTQDVNISADASNLKGGSTYTSSVTFYHPASNTYATVTVTLTVKQANISCIETNPTSISLTSVNNSTDTARITITNCGNITSDWSASLNANWASLSQYSGTLRAGESITIVVSGSGNSLKAGTYSATITISNGEKQAVVTLTMQVSYDIR